MKTIAKAALVVVFVGAAEGTALAQATEGEYMTLPLRGPRRAFEIGVSAGYTQGFGALYPGRNLGDIATAGISLGGTLGYRLSPQFSISASGSAEGLHAANELPQGTSVRGAKFGVEGTFHAAAYERVDPWISVGGGYRLLWQVPENAPSTLTHGFELAKVELGLDMRPNDDIAIAPVLGAALDMFVWQKSPGQDTAMLPDKGLSTFVFAGVKGRFDVGGSRETKLQQAAER